MWKTDLQFSPKKLCLQRFSLHVPKDDFLKNSKYEKSNWWRNSVIRWCWILFFRSGNVSWPWKLSWILTVFLENRPNIVESTMNKLLYVRDIVCSKCISFGTSSKKCCEPKSFGGNCRTVFHNFFSEIILQSIYLSFPT